MKKALTILMAVVLSLGISLVTFATKTDVSSPLPEIYSTPNVPAEKKTTEVVKPVVKADGSMELPETSILTEKSSSDFAPLKIRTKKNTPVYIKIYGYNIETKKYKAEPTKTLFVRAGESITFNMPKGSYKLRYCSGDSWYGEEKAFGNDGIYSELDNTMVFSGRGQGYELILEIVKDGNASSTQIKKDKF